MFILVKEMFQASVLPKKKTKNGIFSPFNFSLCCKFKVSRLGRQADSWEEKKCLHNKSKPIYKIFIIIEGLKKKN